MNIEARVEVLTAEVRVLMVGNRQVTLSVFEQLDSIPYRDCHPFGRVRPKYEGHWIIGSDKDGNLVRACLHLDAELFKPTPADKENYYRLLQLFAQSRELTEGEMTKVLKFERDSHNWWDHQRKDNEAFAAYKQLPLIVLAGLR